MTTRTFALAAILAALFLSLVVFFPPRYEIVERMRLTNQTLDKLAEQYRAAHPEDTFQAERNPD